MDLINIVKDRINSQFKDHGVEFSEFRGELTATLKKEYIVEFCEFLKHDPGLAFILLEDLTAIDWATRNNRFSVVYHIFSLKNSFRLRIKVSVDESECSVDSVSSVWKTANWHERETYDMYGITFNNHPDLRRLYMPEEFEYHPLRKEFPVMGIPGSLTLPNK